ncbi:hypothetical protein N0V90_002786 [Kalmusia sp. IMI 367209]|nr:hypothetical protein N0V90_002786 [Kalmusia sp. IMI 367209]
MNAPVIAYSPGYLAEDIGPTISATAALMIIFCTVFVALRYYARYLTSTKFGAEDVIIPFAWLAEMGLCIVGIDPARLTEHFRGIIINEFLHPAAVAFPKLCVVILFLRVFTNKHELKVSTGRKIGLMLIFLTGSVGIIASIVRTIVFAQTDPLVDITYTNVALVNWTIIEPGLYLIAACALSFKPLFRMVAQALHLGALITHTKSALNKSSYTKTNRTQKDIHMETFKSESSGGFTRLSDDSDRDCKGQEEVVWFKKNSGHKKGLSDGTMSVVITRTVEIQSEVAAEGEEGGKGADHVHFDANVGRAM